MTPSISSGNAASPAFSDDDKPSAKAGLRTRSTGSLPSAASTWSAWLPRTATIGLACDDKSRCATRATIGRPSISANNLFEPMRLD